MRKRNRNKVIEDAAFIAYAALGKALARPEGKVLFAEGVVPGDVADVLITKNKKDWAEGRAIRIKEYSPDRITPVCIHFGVCGGCKWQMLPYEKQLAYKEQETRDVFRKAGIEADVLPIIGSSRAYEYRNKLEFTFSSKEFLPAGPFEAGEIAGPSLGYNIPRMFDKVLNITECHLMDDINNRIRNGFRAFAMRHEMPFYDIRNNEGWLRNLIIRYTTTGECMVNLVIAHTDPHGEHLIAEYFASEHPEVTTLLFTINPKVNDSIYDLEPRLIYGPGYIYEKLGSLTFKISAKSFFQTNTLQGINLYEVTKSFAELSGSEVVYDLYCGTGSIGLYLHDQCKKIIGVEVIEEAVEDARQNARINDVEHAAFFAGDVIKICNEDFFRQHGRPDVVIVDPPRAGLHGKLIEKLIEIAPPKVVYVSCNIATQARDLSLLQEMFHIRRLQPVDMFPQTHHIECVAELLLK